MKAFTFASTAIAGAALVSSVVAQNTNPVDPLVIKGSKFFYKTNGTQFYIRGVAYQQDYSGNGTETDGNTTSTYIDPLASYSNCQRDVPILKELGTNVIRTYAIDPTADHSECMQLLNDNDIYVISDLSSPDLSINRDDPEWTDELYERYTAVIDSLAPYTNVLGFFAGNEVSNAANNTDASAFVKAAVRDMKAYIKSKDYRTIGVGYATNDDASIRVDLADYFNCDGIAADGTNDSIDFWGYNIYSWCGNSNYVESGYQDRTEEFSSYSVPAFFAEYGCNDPSPRIFSEVDAIYGTNMTPVWSGGIVYMYFQEANDYGLVSVIDSSSVSKLADFTSLSSRLAGITATGVNSASYTPTNSPQACPTVGSAWDAAASPLPPTPNEELCGCMYESLECVVSSSVSEDDYGDLFGTVCGYSSAVGKELCSGIYAYGNNGTYGAYSMCNTTEQLGFVLNYYYQLEKSDNSKACSFGGSATTKASSTAASCSAVAAQVTAAGSAGTGTVTATSGSSGTAKSSSSSSSSKGAGSFMGVHHVEIGAFSIAAYVIMAVFSGAAMLVL